MTRAKRRAHDDGAKAQQPRKALGDMERKTAATAPWRPRKPA
jgi:hypothetical protein